MPHLLDDPVQKVHRARRHVNEMEPFIEDIRRTYVGALRTEADSQTGEKRWVVEIDQPPISLDLSLIIGEVIYQYRSALDHLVWQLVIANQKLPTARTAFPIVDDIAKWTNNATQQRIEGVDPGAQAILKSEQPGGGRNPVRAQWLLWLDDLWNVDKHRHIYTTVSATNMTMFNPPLPLRSRDEVFIHHGPIERGTVVASVPAEYAYVDLIFVAGLAFGQGVACENHGVEGLFSCFDYLVGDIIGRCRGFFPPGGPLIELPGNPRM